MERVYERRQTRIHATATTLHLNGNRFAVTNNNKINLLVFMYNTMLTVSFVHKYPTLSHQNLNNYFPMVFLILKM